MMSTPLTAPRVSTAVAPISLAKALTPSRPRYADIVSRGAQPARKDAPDIAGNGEADVPLAVALPQCVFLRWRALWGTPRRETIVNL
jgi:hypothetical protein